MRLHRDIETELLQFCREHGIGVIPYTPLLMDTFAGEITPERVFDRDALPP